jgi:TonB-linked SusC/RagA family outer membrane protein
MKMNFMFFMKWTYRLLAVLAFSLILPPLNAQQNTNVVSGVVTSGLDSEPLIGVSVVLKGTNSGSLTDAEGKYSIRVSGASPVLVFSYLGHVTQEVPVNQLSTINVTLEGSASALNEVVVTALGIQREKKSLGYSVGVVGGESIVKVAQENVFGGLAGKMPGVTLSQTSGPGSSVNMVIRGANSLTTDNQPLFVIDGVPISNGLNNQRQMGDRNIVDYGNAISDINPDDIESISVLKGPSAAALYGSRAGNGVVLIKTKSGQAGRTTVNFSSSNVFEVPTEFLDFHYKFASGNRGNLIDESSAYWTGLPLDKGVTAVQWNSPVGANGAKVPTELRSYKDNMKNFLRTGFTTTNNVSVGGGNEKGNYRIAYNNMLHQGLIPNSDLKRNTISTSLSYYLAKTLRLSSNINLSRSNADNRPATATRTANPLEAVMAYPHVNVLDLQDYWNPGQENIMQRRVFSNVDNPYFLAYELNNGFVRDRVYGNVKLDWDILPSLTAFARVSIDKSDENRETKVPMSYARAAQGGYYLHGLRNSEINTDFLVTYKGASDVFDYSVSAGGNYMLQNYADNYIGGSQLTIPGLYRVSNIPNTRLEYSNFASERAIYGVYGMASLGFKNTLYLDVTARNDWASSLPVGAQSFFYPSASLSWLVNESFKLPSQISLLKLRGGWAQVGNAPGPYQIHQMLGTGSYGNLITSNVPSNLRNPSLKPEIATSTEFGVDLSMFKNRLRFEGTYYVVGNKNQQLPIPLPESSGFGSKLVNAGLIESKGWEFLVGGTPIKDRNGFTWDISVNFFRNRTTVKELVDGFPVLTLWEDNGGGSFAKVGEQLGNLYSRGYARVEDPSSPYYNWPILDNNGKWINVNDVDKRVKVGNYNPDFQMGMQTSLNYKKLSLSASFDWRQGGDFMSFTYRYAGSNWQSGVQMAQLIPGANMSQDQLIAMLKSDPEKYIIPQNGHYPRVGGYDQESGGYWNNNNGTANEAYDGAFIPGVIANGDGTYREHLGGEGTRVYPVSSQFPWSYNQAVTYDASYIKLREIAFGYELPKFWGFRNARVSVFSRNIMLWNAAKIGIDPERAFQMQGGVQGNTSTMMRQGIELQNILPMTSPIGVKLDFTF